MTPSRHSGQAYEPRSSLQRRSASHIYRNEGLTLVKKLIVGLIVAAATTAIMVPLALAGGNSSNAQACQKGGWQNLAREDGTGFNNQDECVSYGAHGGVLNTKPKGPIQVSEPTFNYNVNTCSVTVPYTPGLNTYLYGVNGYSQDTPITHDVTVSAGLNGAEGTAPQFWIGYTAQTGYVDTNPGAGTSHIDFYNGDLIPDCTV
jgi:hypothetical protein